MHIIPVIDLLDGVIVHAQKGQRSQYRPIQSSLTPSSLPSDIVKAFMDVYPFKTLYIADLNAIQQIQSHQTAHLHIIEKLIADHPDLTIWLDAGINTIENVTQWSTLAIQPVLGSESFNTIDQYRHLSAKLASPFTLSLDFSGAGFLGPDLLSHNTTDWPSEIIIMTLTSVGANQGPDIATIQRLMAKSDQHQYYAAGGIRHIDDLLQLQAQNMTGALIASALHNGQITTQALESLNHKKSLS